MRLTLLEVLSFFSVVFILGAVIFGFGETTVYTKTVNPQVASATTYTYSPTGEEFIDTINSLRIQNDVNPLLIDNDLTAVAAIRVNDMVTRQYYAHETPDGLLFNDYFTSEKGYACENLYLTLSELEDPIMGWLKSEDHRKCLLNSRVKNIGYSKAVFDVAINELVYALILSEK